MSLGVIIGRFQVDKLHDGHHHVFFEVLSKHSKVLVLIGCAPTLLTRRDPIDYEMRAKMIQNAYPDVTTAPVFDCVCDEAWSSQIDDLVTKIYPTDEPFLYGGRDSFIESYKGQLNIITVAELPEAPSSTMLRNGIASNVRNSSDFRAGAIYAAYHRYPISYQTVDVAIIKRESGQPDMVLMCQKPYESLWGFIGGFVTPGETLERAARREAYEETGGMESGDYRYLDSFVVEDWRYHRREDQICSAFFAATYCFGKPKASDDIEAIQWMPFDNIEYLTIQRHQPMMQRLLQFLELKPTTI